MLQNHSARNTKSKNLKTLPQIATLFLFFILPLVACPLWGQVVQKKHLTPEDYPQWGKLQLDKISDNEEWVSYKMAYGTADTLFVRNIHTNITYRFSNGNTSNFTTKNGFTCLTKQGLCILNLKTGKQEVVEDVEKYAYSKLTDQLVYLKISDAGNKMLIVRIPFGKFTKVIDSACDFWLSPNEQQLVYSTFLNTKYALAVTDLKKINNPKWIMEGSTDNFIGLTWHKEGKSFAFLSQSTALVNTSLCYYILETKKFYKLEASSLSNATDSIALINNTVYKLIVSDDMQKVFYALKNKPSPKINPTVEVWNGNDKWIYPHNNKKGRFERSIKIALWIPKTQQTIPVSTKDLPKIMLTGDCEYAILSNPKAYEPQFDYAGPQDFYLMNLQTFEQHLFLEKQSSNSKGIIPSPQGKYIAYFKEDNWWIYDVANKTHKNITATMGVKFTAKEALLVSDGICGRSYCILEF